MNSDAEVFDRYRLDELLGRGGMGEVFRAYDLEFERTVAVKRLAEHLADDPRFQERFRREAQHVARLRSPHIVPIHRYGEINGQLYIDMRYVEGGDLADLLARGPVAPERAVRILEQLASALDDAHANGLVHRDVKPSNVLLDGRVADFCYLADFGITRLASDRPSNSLTRTGALLGTLAYMAPEQFDGMATKQSDIYSLTCVFYEMLTGARPYESDALPVLMHAHMNVAAPRPSARNPVAAAFDEVVATGMAKVAANRYASAGGLAEAARAALVGRSADDEPTRPEPDLPTVAGTPLDEPTARLHPGESGVRTRRVRRSDTVSPGFAHGESGVSARRVRDSDTAGSGGVREATAGGGLRGDAAALGRGRDGAESRPDRVAADPTAGPGASGDGVDRDAGAGAAGDGDRPWRGRSDEIDVSGVSAPANPPDVHLEGELHVRRAQDGGGPDVATGDVRTGATTPSTGARTDGTAAGSDAVTDDATAPAGGATPGADDAGAADREPGGAAGIDTVDRKTDVDALVGGPTENLRRSGMGRRWLAPLAVAAVILAVVGATWAIARAGATVPGNPSAARGTAPAAAGASSPAPGAPSPAAAPGAASPASPVVGEAVFTGRTSDNAVTIAVGVKDGRAAGYLCDGSTVEAWLEGTIGGADVTLHGRDPSTVLTAKADPRGLFGTITVGGVSRPFSAAAATGAAGLYQSKRVLKGISVRIGWIVLPDGTQVGIRNEDGVRTPAPALDPATGAAVDGGETVSAERVSGGTVVIG